MHLPPLDSVPRAVGAPDFDNLLAVLRRERPARPTLFEFFLNDRVYNRLIGRPADFSGPLTPFDTAEAFRRAGYDYVTFRPINFGFPKHEHERKASYSLNASAMIADAASFETYPWPDPDQADYDLFEALGLALPKGMKIVAFGPGGVLENAVGLLGFDNLCCLLADEPDLVGAVFDAIGSRLLRYYERVLEYSAVGAIIGNDDWGFKTQPMLSPADLRRYVFPWHRRIVAAAHAAGKPAILHSCGNAAEIWDDIIDDLHYDAKHSYEDAIEPVEDAYEKYGARIAILGGIDVDFVIRSPLESVYERSTQMLDRTESRGGYALGTGNSVPDYVPDANYFAMIRAALDRR